MSFDDYDALVVALRKESAAPLPLEPAPPASLWTRLERDRRRSRWLLRAVWALLGTVIGVGVATVVGHPLVPRLSCDFLSRTDVARALALPVASIVLAAVLVRSATAGGQMLSRALLWSTLLLSTLALIAEPGVVPLASLAGALASGASLLVLGRRGMEPERYAGSFVPVAHRAELTMVMILAVADAQLLLSWASASAWYHPEPGVCGLAMLLATYGLYQLRFWGLMLNLVMNVVVAAGALAGWLEVPPAVVLALTTTAVLQVGVATPVCVAIRWGRPVGPERTGRVERAVMSIVVIGLMVAAVVTFATLSRADIAASCRL